jgi:BirA family transcriptional regulator, biotin operon repressor / biotin---[acetyl-CoA-carboxylase] ligase
MNLSDPLPPEFDEALARAASRLGAFGREVIWYSDVSSTSDVAAALAGRGAAEGLVVAANAQSAGRGRLGRVWVSPPGAGLYLSVVLRPTQQVIPMVTIAAGVAVAEGIQTASGLRAELKWPNDVYIGPRKVAGVLAEASANAGDGRIIRHVVLGFGVNVMRAAYPPDIACRATSLEEELGRNVDRALLMVECLAALAERYTDLAQGRSAGVLEQWRARATARLGCKVRWEATGEALEGIAEDIDNTGALVVRTPSGPIRVTSGEVTWS